MNACRPAGHQPADGAEVTGGGQPACHHHLDGPGQPLDLLQDVRAEQDGPALAAQLVEQVHHVQPLPRVHAVERLVEQQNLRVMDQGRSHLDPLAHALGVGGDPAVRGAGHVEQGDGSRCGGVWVGQLVQLRGRDHELLAGQERVDRVPFRHQADQPVHLRAAPAGLAGHGQLAPRGRQEARDHVHDRRLAGAVRAEQAGHAGLDRHRDVVDGHHVAVPAGYVAQFDGHQDRLTFRYLAARPPRLAARRMTAASP